MYVAKLGGMYFKSCRQNTFLNEVHKIEFTDELNNAKIFGRYNFGQGTNDLLFRQLQYMGAKFYELEEHEADINKLRKA